MALLSEETKPDTNNGVYLGLPKWVRIIGVLGFPAFVAIYLLLGTTNATEKVDAMQKDIAVHLIKSEQHSADFSAYLQEHKKDEDFIQQMFQQQCVSMAILARRDTDVCFPKPTPKVSDLPVSK